MISKCIRPINLLAIPFLTLTYISSVFASIIVTFEIIIPFGGGYDWNNSATFSPSDGIDSGGNRIYFTVYDLL